MIVRTDKILILDSEKNITIWVVLQRPWYWTVISQTLIFGYIVILLIYQLTR